MKVTLVSRDDIQAETPLDKPELLIGKERTKPLGQTLLAQIRESNSDLLCHCCQPPARMFLRYSHKHYGIVNHPIFGKHNESCPLFTKIKGSIERNDPSLKDTPTFHLHSKINDNGNQAVPRQANENFQSKLDTPSVKEPKIKQLMRYLITQSLFNWYYPNKSISQIRALMELKNRTKEVRFGNTTLDKYFFFGHDGFKYCLRTLNNQVRMGKWDGPGRPHGLVLFMTEELSVNGKYAYFDGLSYSYRNTQCLKALDVSGPYLVALSLAQDEHDPAKKIRPTSLFIEPIASYSNPFPIESEFEREFFSSIKQHINMEENKRWSIQKVLLPKAVRYSGTPSPDYILQQKNSSNKVIYRCVISLEDNEKLASQPVPLRLWRANERVSIKLGELKSITRLFKYE